MHKFAALLGIVTIFVGAGYYVSTSRELMLKDQTAPTFQIPTAEEPKKEVDIPIYNEAKRLVTEDYSLEVVSEAPIEFYIIDPAGRVSGRSSSESNEPIPSALYSKQIFEKTQQDAFFLSIPKATLGQYVIHLADGDAYKISIKAYHGDVVVEKLIEGSEPFRDKLISFSMSDSKDILKVENIGN